MDDKTIVDLLKHENARVSLSDAWLVWNKSLNVWVVYHKPYGRKKAYQWDALNETDAVRLLLKTQEE